MLITKALLWGQKELNSYERPRLEAEILLAHLLKCRREELVLKHIEDIDFSAYKALIDRRKEHEPIEYITNSVSFYKYNFFIDKGALIPRPESEILVEKAISLIEQYNIKSVAEIGIGSGALSISIAKECDVQIEASDISKDAIRVAKENIKNFNLEEKVEVKECSMLSCLATPELLISNPPYIDPEFKLDKNVLDYEPHTALFAPNKGRAILFDILDIIKEKGIKYAVCEMGYDQKDAILEYAQTINLDGTIKIYKDYGALDRGFVYIKEYSENK